MAAEEDNTVTIVASAGQSIVYAELNSVRGNEITYTVAQEVQSTDSADNKNSQSQTEGKTGEGKSSGADVQGNAAGVQGNAADAQGSTADAQGSAADAQAPSAGGFPGGGRSDGDSAQRGGNAGGGFSRGEGRPGSSSTQGEEGAESGGELPEGMPEGDFGSGEMPEGMSEGGFGGGEMSEGMPEGMSGEMAQGMMNMFGGSTTSSSNDTFTYNNTTYQLTEETYTTQIPVGTDVTTRLGTVTTFSRLAAGDRVALVVEEKDGQQIIMAVYIIG